MGIGHMAAFWVAQAGWAEAQAFLRLLDPRPFATDVMGWDGMGGL